MGTQWQANEGELNWQFRRFQQRRTPQALFLNVRVQFKTTFSEAQFNLYEADAQARTDCWLSPGVVGILWQCLCFSGAAFLGELNCAFFNLKATI